jgi:hypothetical protein
MLSRANSLSRFDAGTISPLALCMNFPRSIVSMLGALAVAQTFAAEPSPMRVMREAKAAADAKPLYIANRPPLAPSPLSSCPSAASSRAAGCAANWKQNATA